MTNEDVIIAALRALPSDNMRKEEMFAVECALRMAIDLAGCGVKIEPAGDDATIRELTVECIARARRIDQLTTERNDFKKAWEDCHPLSEENIALKKQLSIMAHRIDVYDSNLHIATVRIDELNKEVAGLVSDNGRISVDRGMAIEAIGDGVDVTNSLRNDLAIAERIFQQSIGARIQQGDELRYAHLTIIELERERTKLNQQGFSMALELDAERKRVAELDAALVTERDLVSRLMEENARLQRGDMASEPAREFVVYAPKKDKPSGWGDIPHEVAP